VCSFSKLSVTIKEPSFWGRAAKARVYSIGGKFAQHGWIELLGKNVTVHYSTYPEKGNVEVLTQKQFQESVRPFARDLVTKNIQVSKKFQKMAVAFQSEESLELKQKIAAERDKYFEFCSVGLS